MKFLIAFMALMFISVMALPNAKTAEKQGEKTQLIESIFSIPQIVAQSFERSLACATNSDKPVLKLCLINNQLIFNIVDTKKYFDAHPSVDKFYFTTDGLAFTDETKARDHQKSIKGKPGNVKEESRKKTDNSKNGGALKEPEPNLKNRVGVPPDTTEGKSKTEIDKLK